jgi:hypothetical protein
MMKRIVLLALATALLFPGFTFGQSVESALVQARERYKAGAFPEAVALLLDAVSLIRRNIPLQIVKLSLCDEVAGYADFKAKAGLTLAAGEPLLLYFEVEGYNTLPDNGRYWLSLAEDARVVNQAGEAVFDQKNWVVLKQDYTSPVVPVYFTNRLTGMEKGKYTVAITVRDEYKKKATEKTLEFTVQ